MAIQTDSTPVDEPKNPDGSALFEIFALFLDEQGQKDLATRFRTPGEGYGHIKQDLYQTVLEYFGTYREKHAELAKRPDDIRDILQSGAARARATARPFLERARERVGLVY